MTGQPPPFRFQGKVDLQPRFNVADMRQPAMVLHLELTLGSATPLELVESLEAGLDGTLEPIRHNLRALSPHGLAPELAGSNFPPAIWQVLSALNHILVRLQLSAGWPVADPMACLRLAAPQLPAEHFVAGLLISGFHLTALLHATQVSLEQIARLAETGSFDRNVVAETVNRMAAHAPTGKNNRLLIEAAFHYKIPVNLLPGGVIQFGWGSHARLMNSTQTDRTSAIGASMARNKMMAAAMMRKARIPVPVHEQVNDFQQAIEAARRIGYPVIVKPVDLDRTIGVSSRVIDEEGLREGFHGAFEKSKNVMVEKYLEGESYRLGVLHGQLAFAHRRQLPMVTGDGRSTIEELINQKNTDPRRSFLPKALMRPIMLDAKRDQLLTEQGFNRTSVPNPGLDIRLDDRYLLDNGASFESVLDSVHPDNARLACRIAGIFRLDLAGIDFICPDIRNSWLDGGGGVHDVNAMPIFNISGLHAPYHAVRGLFKGDGRIPVVVMLCETPADDFVTLITDLLDRANVTCGIATSAGVRIGAHRMSSAKDSSFSDTNALLLDPEVNVAVIVTDGKDWLRTGPPCDRFDLLITSENPDDQVRALLEKCSAKVEHWDAMPTLESPGRAIALAETLLASIHHHSEYRFPDPPVKPG